MVKHILFRGLERNASLGLNLLEVMNAKNVIYDIKYTIDIYIYKTVIELNVYSSSTV